LRRKEEEFLTVPLPSHGSPGETGGYVDAAELFIELRSMTQKQAISRGQRPGLLSGINVRIRPAKSVS
jgi:hypothetical protein